MTEGDRPSRTGERPRDGLAAADLVAMYRWMVLTRAYEDRAQELWSTGVVVESLHGSQGQEAIGVGACYGLRADDVILPSLRTRSAYFVRGVSPRQFLAGMLGKATGAAHGKATAHHMAAPASGRANRFWTAEFFASCRDRLHADGVLACRLQAGART